MKNIKINKDNYKKYIEQFLHENSKVNLISKNDEKFLWEKHIVDSLSIIKFFETYGAKENINLLDIGTGGGFPAVPIALTYPNIQVIAIDSISKKIKAVSEIKEKLNIKNLDLICDRVENIDKKFDIVVSRAVSSLKKISEYAIPKLKTNGYFIAYKSKKVYEEIEDANTILKKYNAKIINIIEYTLPLQETLVRNLVVIQKIKN